MSLGLDISFLKDALLPARGLSNDSFARKLVRWGAALRCGLYVFGSSLESLPGAST
jgi:hypothetical protein